MSAESVSCSHVVLDADIVCRNYQSQFLPPRRQSHETAPIHKFPTGTRYPAFTSSMLCIIASGLAIRAGQGSIYHLSSRTPWGRPLGALCMKPQSLWAHMCTSGTVFRRPCVLHPLWILHTFCLSVYNNQAEFLGCCCWHVSIEYTVHSA